MLFDPIFQNVNVTLLCITNVLKSEVSIREGGGEGGVLGTLFLNFLDLPLHSATKTNIYEFFNSSEFVGIAVEFLTRQFL